jgi:predicted nuclease of restriction endonuclease-like RecB superfamily
MIYKPHPMDVCDMFDTTNKTIAQVARHFGLTSEEVKKILLQDTEETR